MRRVYEPDYDKVHYDGPDGLDQVTLCGMTDRIGLPPLEITNKRCTCWACQQIVKYVRGKH